MEGESSSRRHNKLESILQDQSLEPHSLPLKELKEITNDFSDERLLGQGGFGKVYKGVLRNGDMIAVKKLAWTITGIQDKHYENEVCHLMRLKHPNIVQLVGYCSETEKELVQHNGKYVYAEKSERLLCLEYLPKGNLCSHISDECSGLDWGTRYKIIKGICYGLYYLHEQWQASTPIIHRDLKPANILLDNNMVPKIADFGLSRLFGEEQTRTITKNLDGTLGYMAPEYLNRGIITKELDIFSLGVIIIEIMTGHKHYPYKDETSSSQGFIDHVLKKWRNRLENTSRETHCQQIRMCIEIGLLCVKYERAERPTIRQIIKTLTWGGVECINKEREVIRCVPRMDKSIEAAKETGGAAAMEASIHEHEAKKKLEAKPIGAVEKSLQSGSQESSSGPVGVSYKSASVSHYIAPQPRAVYYMQQPFPDVPQKARPSLPFGYYLFRDPFSPPETNANDSDSYRPLDDENPHACNVM